MRESRPNGKRNTLSFGMYPSKASTNTHTAFPFKNVWVTQSLEGHPGGGLMGEPIKMNENDMKETKNADLVMLEKEKKKKEETKENSEGGEGCLG